MSTIPSLESLEYTLHSQFNRLDRSANGIVNADEFKRGLADIGIVASDDTVSGLVRKFERSRDAGLDFNSFTHMFLTYLNLRQIPLQSLAINYQQQQ